jgi:hypothetical protein
MHTSKEGETGNSIAENSDLEIKKDSRRICEGKKVPDVCGRRMLYTHC